MLAVDRTCRLFRQSVGEALPGLRTSVTRSRNAAGRSRYVFIHAPRRCYKVRISDHPVGMRRALSGECDLFVAAGAAPASWAVWLSQLVRAIDQAGQSAGR
jgi:hypothetical protein